MSETFCNLPWDHLYVDTNGKFKICCMTNEYVCHDDGYHLYDILHDKINDVYNSNYMKSLRKKMIQGEIIDTCKKCVNLENNNLTSRRATYNKNYFIANTNSDGQIQTAPSELEVHFGNVCNLKCRMCSQYFSNSIGKELLKIAEKDQEFLIWVKKESGFVNNWTHNLDVTFDWFKNFEIKNKVFNFIKDHVKKLLFVGGEPTIIPEFWELVDFLYENNVLDKISIFLVTNCTSINRKVLEKIKLCKKFAGHLSIDGLYERNRYIRYPSDWNTVLKNILLYKELFNNNIGVAPAWQILNIDQLVDYTIFWNKLNIKINWQPRVVSPVILDFKNFPQTYQNTTADNLEKKLLQNKDNIRGQDFFEVQNIIGTLRNKMISDSDHVKHVVKAFIKYNDTIDKHRHGQTWRQLLPNLVTHLEATQPL